MMRRPPRPLMNPSALGPPRLASMRHMRMRGPPDPRVAPCGSGLLPLHTRTPSHGHGPRSISSCTNSNDRVSMDARLFVGNLNTLALSKEEVDDIFSFYGEVFGISLHKGYAFVQFRNPDDARWAGACEDGKMYAGQMIDINIVSQPKNRCALKRSSTGKGNNNSHLKKSRQEYPSTNHSLKRNLVTLSGANAEEEEEEDDKDEKKCTVVESELLEGNADTKKVVNTVAKDTSKGAKDVKKVTKDVNKVKADAKPVGLVTKPASSIMNSLAQSKSTMASNISFAVSSDILICGGCKIQFSSLQSLTEHKKVVCRLRFTCHCRGSSGDCPEEPALLQCASCDRQFSTAWALCQHCTHEHHMAIFKSNVLAGHGPKEG